MSEEPGFSPPLRRPSSSAPPLAHLDAVLEEVAQSGVPLLLVQGLTEDDDLLEEEDPPLLHPGQEASVLVRHHEGVLQ